MKGSGACDNRQSVIINSIPSNNQKLTFTSFSQTTIIKNNQILIEFRKAGTTAAPPTIWKTYLNKKIIF